ncbi:hypothetical protein JK386_06455 [Nocardioides sp. zg-536]|uniref:Uncharacterized protein n=1 Tax=Nocardioides faecalis TaxID=2803858 RepID=A0A939BVG7_9ACTN|nr:hypothetical protein [Nocardioides faecalis]MBM9459537.1 hypothetical protein [Nocardioides faecalis]MBS4753683.1 hypothetical protein [Nocardioides faecalis]QVI58070.1 hypothetical protein KG111_13750 [Nocardioides faecalis]
MQALAITLVSSLLAAKEQVPDDEDVVAGWTGFAVLVFLIIAVALIGWALSRQLRRVDAAKRRGVFGDAPEGDDTDATGPSGSAGSSDAGSSGD